MNATTALSVNVNKVAVLRNSRGGDLPDPLRVAEVCIGAGCHGVTVHPRPDQRHVRPDDVRSLRRLCAGRVEFNIEGNPFAPARDGYPGLLPLVCEALPEQCTLVPDGDGQLTSDHGFDPLRDSARLAPMVASLRDAGVRVSVFVDPGTVGFGTFRDIGIDRVEIYTGPFAQAHACGADQAAIDQCVATAESALAAGLGVNAGHDLSQGNLGRFLATVPGIAEVSIGHALISEALFLGIAPTVQAYLRIIREAR